MTGLESIVEALVVRPGDTLVVRVRPAISAQQVDEIKRELSERLPGVKALIVAAEEIAVYRPRPG
jgi:hypothetical protein